MAANRTAGRRADTTQYRKNYYVNGSAVRKDDVRRQIEEPKKQLSHTTRKNRERARHMNLAYVFFLAAAMVVTGCVLISYIWVQSSITTSIKRISYLESQVNNQKLKNDETLGRIESSVDLEEIRRIAITELGMVYAQEGQIIEIPDEGSDYVRQYADIQK
ncbi:MAG: cell division protein FtsL [Eubacteriales bacterium]|nr:cell division protein FtsL [Eubacteriales bacterium]